MMDKLQDAILDIDNYLCDRNPPDDIWDACAIVIKAAQSYADLPAKIEGMKNYYKPNEPEFFTYERAKNDILNLINERT